MKGNSDMKDGTKCLHSGYSPKNSEPRVVPIVQSTTYVYDTTEEIAEVLTTPQNHLFIPALGIQPLWL